MSDFALKLRAAADLVHRYRSEFSRVWQLRKQLEGAKRARRELEFLPATLSLVETPVHPAPRWIVWLIVISISTMLAFAAFGRLDIVATATGKLIPANKIKLVQPAITGVVTNIYVKNGQLVRAGDVLLDLDPTQSHADRAKAHETFISASLAAVRSRALLAAQASGVFHGSSAVAGATPTQQRDSDALCSALFVEYMNRMEAAQADLQRKLAENESSARAVEKLRATAPLARQQADQYKALVDKGYVSRSDFLQREQAAQEQEHDLDLAIGRRDELAASVANQQAVISQTRSSFTRQLLDTLDQAEQQIAQTEGDETKAAAREGLTRLTSPVDGTVQQLNANTLGGVVTTAQSIMEIVPNEAIEMEVLVKNKDIGFVRVGQRAIIKLDAFPYMQYGYIDGIVQQISNDSIEDKKNGLSFVARIRLERNKILVDGRTITLTPGLSATADIKTGHRSVARYFIDPLVQTASQGLRER